MTSAPALPRLKPLALAILAAFPLVGVAQTAIVRPAPPAASVVPRPLPGWRVSGTGGAVPVNTPNARGGTDQVVNQTSQRAIYNWQSFDIGAASSVTFNLPGASSSALNRVLGSQAPSQIFGALTSQYANPVAGQAPIVGGTIYLINQNGILFGRTGQVNTGALIASTLNLADADFNAGLTQSINGSTPSFAYDGEPSLFVDGRNYVRVDEGATITTASGGRVFLFAKNVQNAGAIATPDGQTVLAAGAEVYLNNPTTEKLYASEASVLYPTVNGLLVEVGQGNGSASNLAGASIETLRGNTTLVGMAVNQMGRISATTSVSQNGSVMLLARGNAVVGNDGANPTKRATTSGALTLGSASTIEVAADTAPGADGKPATSDGNALFTTSRVELAGRTIELQPGARITAHGGIVNARAEATPYYQDSKGNAKYDASTFTGDTGARLVIGDQAVIDVSGTTDTSVSVARNFVTTALIGKADLKDAPLQKDGVLYRSKLTFDVRAAVPILGDTSAYQTAIQRTADERLAAGGSISLTSTGSLATNPGSTLNVSGGAVDYTAAQVTPTRLVTADGTRYTLDKAPVDLVYTAIEGSAASTQDRWGTVPNYVAAQSQTGHLEAGYVDGKAGGSLTLVAPHAIVDGAVQAATTAGVRQTGGQDALATSAALVLGFRTNLGSTSASFGDSGFVAAGLGDFTITAAAESLPADFWAAPLTGALPTHSRIAAKTLDDSGAGTITITSDAGVTVEPGAALTLTPKATLDLAASGSAGIALGSSVRSEGGSVVARTRNASNLHVGGATLAGGVTLQPGASIDVSGDWVNRALDGATAAAATAGGNVTLSSAHALVLADASRIDVSGGATVATSGSVAGTRAGSVTLESDVQRGIADRASRVHLGADLKSQSLTGGGTLALHGMDAISIGSGNLPRGVKDGTTTGSLLLSSGFFEQGAFTNYDVQAFGSLQVLSGASVAPQVSNWILTPAASFVASGTAIASFLDQGVLPDAQRVAASVALGAVTPVGSAAGGDLKVAPGSGIRVDPLGAVTLTAGLNLDLEGRVTAPGGNVTLALKSGAGANVPVPAQGTLTIGSGAVVDVSGTTVLQPQTGPLPLGTVLAGGDVEIEVSGNTLQTPIRILPGAVIAADGASARLGVAQTLPSGSRNVVAQDVASDGGSITIGAALGGAAIAGDLHAHAGAAGASAGSFTFSLSGTKLFGDPPVSLLDSYTLLLQNAPVTSATATAGVATLSAQSLGANFADVSLTSGDRIRFLGDVDLAVPRNLTLDAPLIVASPQSRAVSLSAGSALLLGSTPSTENPSVTTPIAGPTTLALDGGLVEFYGTQGYRGFQGVTATAGSEIRLNGVNQSGASTGRLQLQSALTLSAPQVTVTSQSDFTIDAPGQTVLLTGGDVASAAPLSAGGAITINARRITTANPADGAQVGVLRAPFGHLTLNATDAIDIGAGSLLSVSGNGQSVLYGSTVNGTQWAYNGQSVAQPAEKTVNLTAASVNVAAGATVDASGGSDLVATEFVAGAGGSKNVFAGAGGGAFAVVPTVTGYAPQDADTLAQRDATGAAASTALGRQITFGAGGPIAAGTYTVLPARYALMAGAYLIRPVASTAPMTLGGAVTKPDGSVLVGARYADLGTAAASPTSTVQVLTSAQARAFSEIRESSANTYFAAQASAAGTPAPRVPQDAGRIAIAATQLALKGKTAFDIADRAVDQGGELDIAADRIRIGDTSGAAVPAGVLALDTADLNAAGAAVLVLGGTRSANTLQATASEVVLDNAGQALKGADVIVIASDRIDLREGAAITATGTGSAGRTLALDGDGALLRVASDATATTVRTGVLRQAGDLTIGAASTLSGGSITAEATHATTIAADAAIQARSVTIGASRIAAGDLSGASLDPTTLALSPTLAAQLGASQSLTLRSFGGLALYGTATLGGASVKSLALDTGSLEAVDGAVARVEAGGLTLLNSAGSTPGVTVGTGLLTLAATGASGGTGQITIGPGSTSISGASAVSMSATKGVLVSGTTSLASAGDLTIHAPALQAAQGADATLTAGGAFTLDSGNTTAPAEAGSGAHLAISAASIEQAGRVSLPSGQLTLQASGPVHFAAGSVTDASGRARTFDGVTITISGGSVRASSAGGDVVQDAGATIDVSVPAGTGGAAGNLALSAPLGSVAIGGSLRGVASAGQGGGSLSIDSAMPLDLGALAATLAAIPNNFSESISVRNRAGDQSLAAGGPGLVAHHIALSTDSGSLDIAGTLDASGASGPSISLAAGQTLRLSGNALLSAHSTGSTGGEVQLMAGTLALDANGEVVGNGRVQLDGGRVDTTAAAGGSDGTLLIRAQRDDANRDVRIGSTAGSAGTSVAGVRSVEVEGVKQYLATEIDTDLIAQVVADNAAFGIASAAASLTSRLGTLLHTGSATAPTLQLRAGVEIDQPDAGSDLLVTGSPATGGWNLTTFNRLGQAVAQGTGAPMNLTLRSAGDLLVQASLSDGYAAGGTSAAAASKIVPLAAVAQVGGSFLDGARIRLVGGADFGAADVTATGVSPDGRGNVVIGNDGSDVIVRSTTGAIQIAAAADVTLTDHRAVVYTTGKPVDAPGFVGETFLGTSLVRVGSVLQSPTLTGGGGITVQAARDVVGFGALDGAGQYASEWLWRGSDALTAGQATWWARYDKFQQGFATFGGGNVRIDAGRDAVDVEASAASSGYIARDATGAPSGAVRDGGGDLTLWAGRDVVDGFVLQDVGRLTVASGRSIVASSVDQPALQVLHGASTVDIEARNDATVGAVTSFGLVAGSPQGGSRAEARSLVGLGAGATLRLASAAGDLTYQGVTTTDAAGSTAVQHSDAAGVDKIVPDSAVFAAPGGSVTLGPLIQSSGGSTVLSVLAGQNVSVDLVKVRGTDARQATPTLIDDAATLGDIAFGVGQTPLDSGDRSPVRLVAGEGDVTIQNGLQLTKPLRMIAGRDVVIGRGVVVQHQAADELSLVEAGRDIVFGATGSPVPDFKVYGPGDLLAVAGRNVDLSTSGGFGALGNRENGVLPAQSAGLTVLAGVSLGSADYAQAAAWYFPLLGGTGIAGYAADLAAQLGAVQTGAALPAPGSSAALAFKASAIDAQIATTRALVGDAVFEAAVLADAQRRNALATTPLATLAQADADKSFAALAAGEQAKVLGAALANAWAARLTAQQQRDTVLAMAAAQGTGASNAAALVAFVAAQTGTPGASPSLADALVAFQALPPERRALFTNQVLTATIRSAGRVASAATGAARDAAYAVAYDALAVVFPDTGSAGSLLMGSSQVHTFQHSAVTILAPRGGVDVGEVSTPVGTTPKAPNALGIVTAAGGDIGIVVRDSVEVNQSRVFSVGRGDLLMWASKGDLDAGRGAKTITGAAAPVFSVDSNGNFVIDTSGSFSGSGIAVLDANSTLDLYAPKGEINAGDAGIKSVGNAYFGAVRFVGADNLSVGGVAVGAPPPPPPAGGSTAGLANAGQSILAATQIAPTDSDEEKERKRRRRLNLILDFIGFGDGSTKN